MVVFDRKFLFTLLCFFSIAAQCQDYSTKNFSVEDGLPHSRVVVLHEDSLGYLWIGTYGGGISRFDGRKFESFDESNGLLSSVVLGIQVDSKDNVWVCTPLGISKFNGVSFKNFTGHLERGFFGMDVYEHHDTIYTLLKAANDWRFGVIFQDSIIGKNYTFGMQDPIVNAFAADNNTLYLNLANGDIIKKSSQFKKIAGNFKVLTFFKSRFGIHALTPEGVFDLTDEGPVPRFQELQADWITIDQDFTYAWVWKENKLIKFSFSGSTWKEENTTLPFESSFTMIDSEGNNWFGTIGKGLFRLSRKTFTKLNQTTSTYCFTMDRDSNLWVGSENGIEIYNSSEKLIQRIDFNNAGKNRVNSLVKDLDGSIWAGTMSGLARVSDLGKRVEWFSETQGLNSNAIRSLEVDGDGKLWIGYLHGKGLSIFDGHENVNISTSDGLLVESVWDLKYSRVDHSMFICTDLGVQRFKNGEFETIDIPEFKNKILLSLGLYKENYLLVGSGGAGLANVNILNGSYSILTTKDGLASNFIYLADSDSSNYVWVGTVKGIDKISIDENLTIKSLMHYGSQSGLGSNGVNTNAGFIENNAHIFGLTDGAYKYTIDRNFREINFPLHFVQIKMNNGFIDPSVDTLFESNQNEFEFVFNKVDKRGVIVRYQYILENWDKNWVSSPESNRVIYGNLLPGNYVYRVKAANSEGIWIDEIAFSFTIRAPFYQRAWFKIGALLLIVFIVFAIFYARAKTRVNQIVLAEKARNEESLRLRKEIGRDFHDEVGNQLARIINYLGLLKMPSYKDKDEVLDKAEETSKYLLTGTKDFLWSIDPIHDNLDSVCVHIRDFGEKLLEEKGMEFRFYSDAHTNTRLPFGFTRQINLIFKEALTNAFKHSHADKVALYIHQNTASIQITLEDNGKGFDENEIKSGDGFRNMHTRADKINASLKIANNTQKGMTVKLLFNVK